MSGEDTELIVQKDDQKSTTLFNPKTKETIITPKDPKKPGKITQNDAGEMVINKEEPGVVTPEIKPGMKVKVNSQGNK